MSTTKSAAKTTSPKKNALPQRESRTQTFYIPVHQQYRANNPEAQSALPYPPRKLHRGDMPAMFLQDQMRAILYNDTRKGVRRNLSIQWLMALKSCFVPPRATKLSAQAKLLLGRDLHHNLRLHDLFLAHYIPTINKNEGIVTLTTPPFVPAHTVKPPDGATHFKLYTVYFTMHFTRGDYDARAVETPLLPAHTTDEKEEYIFQITNVPCMPGPLFVLFGIEFFHYVNNEPQRLADNTGRAFMIVGVNVEED